ncbi:hypothetical protein SKAU_G00380030 [Synaphobranchus kaupii]|uniref:Uncharacterized protein n=1 Tax=Synaphobranchus kaupii TaxID=118154 RepID=A0A9Q1EDG9_SYNKA|nr:hypothetical protein SKAU_G00380030 [Synaphobranchus kaupii]
MRRSGAAGPERSPGVYEGKLSAPAPTLPKSPVLTADTVYCAVSVEVLSIADSLRNADPLCKTGTVQRLRRKFARVAHVEHPHPRRAPPLHETRDVAALPRTTAGVDGVLFTGTRLAGDSVFQ